MPSRGINTAGPARCLYEVMINETKKATPPVRCAVLGYAFKVSAGEKEQIGSLLD